jgi:hypothetical protein
MAETNRSLAPPVVTRERDVWRGLMLILLMGACLSTVRRETSAAISDIAGSNPLQSRDRWGERVSSRSGDSVDGGLDSSGRGQAPEQDGGQAATAGFFA